MSSKTEGGVWFKVVLDSLDNTLFTITTSMEEAVVAKFVDWFNSEARLKPLPDLAMRIAGMEPKLRKMAKNLDVSIHEGRIVVRSDADSETLLSLLRRGSDWFDPHPGVDAAIVTALVESAS